MAEVDSALLVAKIVDEMRNTGGAPTDQDLTRLAAQISSGFKVSREEVAILRLSADVKVLIFLYPIKLSKIGAIPLTAAQSLATKTIRDKRGEIVNNFPAYRHLTVFEAVDLSGQSKALPIQKIMSSPMISEGRVVGVIQISRKARPGDAVGPDFTQADLAQLTAVGSIVGKYISEFPVSSLPDPESEEKT